MKKLDLTRKKMQRLSIQFIVFLAFYFISTLVFEISVSRRMVIIFVYENLYSFYNVNQANASYVFWVVSVCIFFLWSFFTIDYVITRRMNEPVPIMFQAINFNLLPIFLLANVLTGVVNLTINTLTIGPQLTILIMTFYILLNILTAFILERNELRIKIL